MRTQSVGGVEAVLDGDAHCHVWEPNAGGDDPLDLDLTEQLAFLVHHGRDAPPAPEPHWTDQDGLTVILALDVGTYGSITIDGHGISPAAATRLAGAGFVRFLRDLVEADADDDRSDASPDDDGGEEVS